MGRLRQRHEAIPITFGVAHMHTPAHGIEVADLQAQALPQAQSQAVACEEEHPVTEHTSRQENPPGFLDDNDVRQALALGRLDQAGGAPGFAQNMLVVALQSVPIELDRAPGMRREQLREEVGQWRFGQTVDLMIEARADAANGASLGVNRLGLQPLEFQVLQVARVVLLEGRV